MERTTLYKHKVRKLEFSKLETESSSRESTKHNIEKHKYSSESNDSNQRRKKQKPHEEILGQFKKIKFPLFNGEIKKGEEEEAWISRMKSTSIFITTLMN